MEQGGGGIAKSCLTVLKLCIGILRSWGRCLKVTMHKLIISGQYWTSSSPPQYLVKVLYQQLVLDHNDPAADCHVKGVVK